MLIFSIKIGFKISFRFSYTSCISQINYISNALFFLPVSFYVRKQLLKNTRATESQTKVINSLLKGQSVNIQSPVNQVFISSMSFLIEKVTQLKKKTYVKVAQNSVGYYIRL